MNAQIKIHHTYSQSDEDIGHIFRGEYINICSQVEEWAINVLQNPKVTTLPESKPKLPHLFGKKLSAIESLIDKRPELFKNDKCTIELISEFKCYAELRSDLAHAVMKVYSKNNETIFVFTNFGQTITPKMPKRFSISISECQKLLKSLRHHVKKITDQKLK